MKFGNNPHNIVFQVNPKIINEAEVNTIKTQTLETITVSNFRFTSFTEKGLMRLPPSTKDKTRNCN